MAASATLSARSVDSLICCFMPSPCFLLKDIVCLDQPPHCNSLMPLSASWAPRLPRRSRWSALDTHIINHRLGRIVVRLRDIAHHREHLVHLLERLRHHLHRHLFVLWAECTQMVH